jgi:phosphatidylglycerol lysyltransferase
VFLIQREWALAAAATTGLLLGTRRGVTVGRHPERVNLEAGLVAHRAPPGTMDHAQAEAIVRRYGRTPLDYFKLWPDKSYYFSSSRESVVAYRVACSVAIGLGDPVGPIDEIEPLIQSFLSFCDANGWSAAFYQVLPDFLPMYRRRGLCVLKIGEEALVDLERFATRTIRLPGFRKPRRRLGAQGYCVRREPGPHPDSVLDEAEEVSREWLALPGRRERSFALGRFDRGYLAGHPLVVVRDPAGRLVAFANQVPGIRSGVATVDLMRHRRETPNGLMDYLFSELMLLVHGEGYRWFSLGLAPLAGVAEKPGAGLAERAVREVYEHSTTGFSFKGLRSYKAKFEPAWEERFLVHQNGHPGLLWTALALGRITHASHAYRASP